MQQAPGIEDSDLVSRYLQTRDPALFRLLVERHRANVFRLALSILGPGREADAEEAAQEVFLQVYRRLDGYRRESRFSTWLYRIAWNRAVDWRRRALSREKRIAAFTGLRQQGADGAADPFAAALAAERGAQVRRCVEQLPDLYRAVVHQHYWLGCPVEEIAALLGAPPNTVKSYLRRARQQLQRLLSSREATNE